MPGKNSEENERLDFSRKVWKIPFERTLYELTIFLIQAAKALDPEI